MIKTKKYTVKEKLKAAVQPHTSPVKNCQGKTFNSGFVTSIMLHRSSHDLISSMCPKHNTYEKFILRMIQTLRDNDLLEKEVISYKLYPKMNIK